MTQYKHLYNAVVDAMEQLDRRNYNSDGAVAYVHPNTWSDALKDSDAPFNRAGDTQSIVGCEVLRNPNLPTNVVMLVDVEMAPRSNGAVAFGRIGD